MITPEQKKLFAIIGNPVDHSLTPVLMNSYFNAFNVPAVCVAFRLDEVEKDLEILHKVGLSGMSVTIPHKEAVFRLAERVDKTAEEIGAANTLRRTDSGWDACNTDWIGTLRALSAVMELSGRNALVLGAGGAARAVVYGLKRAGALVSVSNRGVQRGMALCEQLGGRFLPLEELDKAAADFDVVVQCTSAGMGDAEASPIPFGSFFRPGMVIMDIVYSPQWTAFLRAARDAGCTVVSGLEMLLYQGVAQLEWWLDHRIFDTPAVDTIRQALEEAVDE